jgi:adhesin HecA-like repeat protein
VDRTASGILEALKAQVDQLFPDIPAAGYVEASTIADVHVFVPAYPAEYCLEVARGNVESLIVRVIEQSVDMKRVILDTILSPFMADSCTSLGIVESATNSLAHAEELVSRVADSNFSNCEESSELPGISSPVGELPGNAESSGSDVSMGYRVTIPQVGDVLISHGGDVVLGGVKVTNPLQIVTPSSVVVNDVRAGQLAIESSTVVFISSSGGGIGDGGTSGGDSHGGTNIESLSFQSNSGGIGGIYVDKAAYLGVGELSASDALLVNRGEVAFGGENSFHNVSLLNSGKIETMHAISDISHLWNCAGGIVRSANNLVVSAATVSNIGNLVAKKINIIAGHLLSNFGNIQAAEEVNIYGDGDVHNHGVIGGNTAKAYVTGKRFRQYGDGGLVGSSITLNSKIAELDGKLDAVEEISFSGPVALLNGVKISSTQKMTLSTGDNFLASQSAQFGKINELVNRGIATFKCGLGDVASIANAEVGELRLLASANVTGGVVNDGHIFVHGGKDPEESNSLLAGAATALPATALSGRSFYVKGEYVGAKDSIVEYANGGTIMAGKYTNLGTSFSHSQLQIEEYAAGSSYGHVRARDTIEYHVHGSIEDFGGHVIAPTVEGNDKRFILRADGDITVTTPFNSAVRMEILAHGKIENRSAVAASSISIKSVKDGEEHWENALINRGTLSSSEKIDVLSESFLNDGGKIQAHGNVAFRVSDEFKNTGGGRLEKDVEEEITIFEPVAVQLNPNAGSGQYSQVNLVEKKIKVRRDICHPELEKSGMIATDRGQVTVSCGTIDNSFGIVHGGNGVSLTSRGEAINESGLLISGGKTKINGTQLRNGYRKASQVYDSVNPNRPIRTEKTIGGRWHEVPNMQLEKVGTRHWWKHRSYEWVQRGMRRENLPDIREFVLTGYKSMPQAGTASTYPGYIFSGDDVTINTELPAYVGTIVSENDILVKGESIGNIGFNDRGTVIAHGNVRVEMEKAATDQVAIQAENISIKLMEDFIINGVVYPTLLPDGTTIHMLDIRKFAHCLGMLNWDDQTEEGNIPEEDGKIMPVRSSDACGFTGEHPGNEFIISSVPDGICRTIINLALAPTHGRETIIQENLLATLEHMGWKRSEDSSVTPAILYRPREQSDLSVTINGESVTVPICDPVLLFDATSKLANIIQAQKKVSLQSMKNIQINPGEINVRSSDIDFIAGEKVAALSHMPILQAGKE